MTIAHDIGTSAASRRRLEDRIDTALERHPSINTPTRVRQFRLGYHDRYLARRQQSEDAAYLAGWHACTADDDTELRNTVASYTGRPRFASVIAEADPRFRTIDYEGDDGHDR